VRKTSGRDADRSTRAVKFGRPVFVILGAAEIRQKIGVPPSYDAPAIVTAPVPAAINQALIAELPPTILPPGYQTERPPRLDCGTVQWVQEYLCGLRNQAHSPTRGMSKTRE